MNNKHFTLLCTLLLFTLAHAQVLKPRVSVHDLTFDAPFEAKMINDLAAHREVDWVKAFVAADGVSTEADWETVQKRLDEVKQQIKVGHNDAETIRAIHNAIIIEFALTYDANASFRQTVERGIYNSYTLTAVYMCLFKRFGIGYAIYETEKPFLTFVADPEHENLVIETGKMGDRYFEPLKDTKERFVNFLGRNGTITELESKKPASMIWDQYAIARDTLSPQHLLSLYYLNKGLLAAVENTRYVPGLLVEKSTLLYPTLKNSFFLPLLFGADVEHNQVPDSNMLTSYIKHVNYVFDTAQYDGALEWFSNTFAIVYIEHNAPETMEQLYNRLMVEIKDSSYRKMLIAEWCFQRARLLHAEGQFTEVIAIIDPVYRLNPDNQKLLLLLVKTIFDKLSKSNASDQLLLADLDNYCNKYKKMRELDLVKYAYAMMYLDMAGDAFNNNNIASGVSYMHKYKALGPVKVDYTVLGNVYSEWSSYYARKNDPKKARQYLLEGMQASPNNPVLKRKLKLLDDYTQKGKY